MKQNETQWDKLLKIKTSGRDDSNGDNRNFVLCGCGGAPDAKGFKGR